jgi:hypothetical protein
VGATSSALQGLGEYGVDQAEGRPVDHRANVYERYAVKGDIHAAELLAK